MFFLGGRLYQYSAALACQLSVVVAGAAFVWLEPFTLRLTEGEVKGLLVSPQTVSWLVAIVEAGCLVASPTSGILANTYGRKSVILAMGPLCLLSFLLLLVSTSLPVLFLVRFLQGLATGIAFTVTPIYTAEIAEPEVRGRVSGIFQVALYVGVLFSFIIGPYLTFWNYIIASIPIPVLFMVSFTFFHESPYFLLMSGSTENAERSLIAFRGTRDVSKEFEEMRKAVAEEMSAESSWSALFGDPLERKAFIIVQIVTLAKFLTGMLTIVNYATEIFSTGGGILSPEELTIILGCLLVGTSIASAFLSDYIGRRCLLLVSCYGVFVSHLFTGTYFYLKEMTSVNANPFVILMYIGLIGYSIFSNIGLGPLQETLQSEMFNSKTRGLAGGLTEAVASIFSFVVLKAYRPINDYYGEYLNFSVYCVVGLIAGILLTFLMYETKGKTIGKTSGDEPVSTTKL